MKSCVIVFLSCFIQINNAAIYRLKDDEYELMPPIVDIDPFEKCICRPGGRYCTAYATFVADEPSPLLNQMQEYSAHTASHYNHTRILFGTCLTHKCINYYDGTTADLGRVLEACLNQSVWEKYNLKVKVEENISCHEHNEKKLNIEAVDIAVAAVLLGLVACNTVGSLFDIFYTKHGDGLVAQFFICFSIPRNWSRLVAPPGGGDPRLDSFKGIFGVRAILMTLVIAAHALLPAIIACANPKFVEDRYEEIAIHLMLNGPLIMQTFLFLSALMLVYNSQLYAEHHQISWRWLSMSILRRWLRLTPSYAVVLAATATWQRHASSGPLWDKVVVPETLDCRHNWWKHLLYLNNYDASSTCMLQAWYLATDTQLYCLGVAIVVLCRSARSKKVLLPILFVIGLIIPALHTYYQDLDAVLIVSPATVIGFFRTDRTYNEVYIPGHTNIASYILGVACGYLVYHLQKNNFDANKYRKWRPLYWLLCPLLFSIVILCKVFYGEGPRVGLVYRALVAALIKPVIGIVTGLLIVGMILKIDQLYRELLEWRGWTCLGRMSYSAYLLHVAFIRIISGAQTEPVHTSYQRIVEMVLFFIVVTYIAACLFWITVEAPLGQLVNTCLDPRPGRAKSEVDENTQKTDKKL